MAQFRVGQRVKVVYVTQTMATCAFLVGKVGTVATGDLLGFEYVVKVDGHTSNFRDGNCRFYTADLAPLTDPKAEEFIEGLRKLAREPVSVPPAVLDDVIEVERS